MILKMLSLVVNQKRKRTNEQQHTRIADRNNLKIENILKFPASFSINLPVFYHECCSLIGYATHYLFCDSELRSSMPLLTK